MSTVASLVVKLSTDTKNMETGFKNAAKSIDKFGKSVASAGKDLTKKLTLPLVGLGVGLAKSAMDLEATEAKYNTVFAGMTEASDNFIKEFQKLTPATTAQARNMASGIQDLLIPMGFLREEATDMTRQFMHVSGALANFNSGTHTSQDVTNAMQSAITGMYMPLKRLGIQLDATTVQQKALEMGLIQSKDEMNKTIAAQVVLSEVYAQSGDALEAYTEANLDAKTKLGLLKSDVIDLAAKFGEQLIPVINDLMEHLRKAMAWLEGLSEEQRRTILIVAGLAAAFGPLLLIIGKIISVFSVLISVFGFLLSPIGLVIAAIVGLAALFIYLWHTNEDFRNKVTQIWNTIKDFAINIFQNTLKPLFEDVFNSIKETVIVVSEAVSAFWDKWGDAILATAKIVWNQIKLVITTAVNILKDVIGLIMAVIRGDWDEAWKMIISIGQTYWNYITGTFNNLKQVWGNIWDGLKNKIIGVWEGIKTGIKSSINSVINIINSFINKINSISISVPSVDIPLVGQVGGFEVGMPQIPKIPNLAKGGLVMPRPGGTLINAAERGQAEIISPIEKLKGLGSKVIHIDIHDNNINNEMDIDRIGDMLIKKLRAEGVA